MKTTIENINIWNELYERGDALKLSKIIGLTTQNITKLLKSGEGSIHQIASVQKFYKKRKIEINNINKQID